MRARFQGIAEKAPARQSIANCRRGRPPGPLWSPEISIDRSRSHAPLCPNQIVQAVSRAFAERPPPCLPARQQHLRGHIPHPPRTARTLPRNEYQPTRSGQGPAFLGVSDTSGNCDPSPGETPIHPGQPCLGDSPQGSAIRMRRAPIRSGNLSVPPAAPSAEVPREALQAHKGGAASSPDISPHFQSPQLDPPHLR